MSDGHGATTHLTATAAAVRILDHVGRSDTT
jgi:hypothetical protein